MKCDIEPLRVIYFNLNIVKTLRRKNYKYQCSARHKYLFVIRDLKAMSKFQLPNPIYGTTFFQIHENFDF